MIIPITINGIGIYICTDENERVIDRPGLLVPKSDRRCLTAGDFCHICPFRLNLPNLQSSCRHHLDSLHQTIRILYPELFI